MAVAPERELKACMRVLYLSTLKVREWGWSGDIPYEQLSELMDAIHNIPTLIQHWEFCDPEWLLSSFDSYDKRWGKSGGLCLRAIYESAMKDDNHS